MNHASLFSGIGGFDLAAQWAGWNNVFQVEIDSFCQKVLQKNFPNAKKYTDIKEFDGTPWTGAIDIISGGFPCQPFSQAGKRKGTSDDRALWPEMLRVICEIRPAWVVAENVSGLLTIENGLAFDKVLSDLEAQHYEVQPYIIPAVAQNAPHRRDRIWIIARAQRGEPWQCRNCKQSDCRGLCKATVDSDSRNTGRDATDATCKRAQSVEQRGQRDVAQQSNRTIADTAKQNDRRHWREPLERQAQQSGKSADERVAPHTKYGRPKSRHKIPRKQKSIIRSNSIVEPTPATRDYRGSQLAGASGKRTRSSRSASELHSDAPNTQDAKRQRNGKEFYKTGGSSEYDWNESWLEIATRICRVDDGLPPGLDRTNRLKALGNAIVPQIAYKIFEAINQISQ